MLCCTSKCAQAHPAQQNMQNLVRVRVCWRQRTRSLLWLYYPFPWSPWSLILDQTVSWPRVFKELSSSLAAAPFTFSQLLPDLVQNFVNSRSCFAFMCGYTLGFHLWHVLVHLLQVDWDVNQLFMRQLQHMVRWQQGMGFCLPASLTHWMCWKRTCRQGETTSKIKLAPMNQER